MFPTEAGPWTEALANLWSPGIWVFLGALMVSLLATPLVRRLAMRRGIWDQPDDAVKIHKQPIPYLGGCAIWLAWTAAVVVYYAVRPEEDWRAVAAVVGGGVVAFITGLVDDLKDIRPLTKLLGQALAGAILLLGGVRWYAYASYPGVPFFDFGRDSWFVVIVCLAVHFLVVLGATNATNLLDGLDGLCSGVTAIISIGFLLLATALVAWARYGRGAGAIDYEYTDLIMVVSFALAGAAIGFLPYNFNPARIFMGDAGSVFIGYVLAAMMIMFASKFGMVKWFVGALFIFGLPIFDTGVALIRRLANRRPVMMPDRSHLYNQLVDRLGLSVRATVGILYGLSVVLAVAGLLVLYLKGRHAAILYVVMGAIFLTVVWRLGFLRMTPEEKAAADRFLARKRGGPWRQG
ncbi:MAG: undecaprenyl/decaprenyl-phosphate alpha-N-acetylglucosaminyl 1-phosphate transferase [Planctomycetes bacterium]|nr:undecaprenyl/decaprenyl-phosphate alpha-N-acetylglucosaminyl 1-phosphate transferase [Planctomycetota bacterium]